MHKLFAAVAFLAMSAPVYAQDVGVPVTIAVKDVEGAPIGTAVIRPKAEKTRHRVNVVTGEWTESVLYLDDGSEFIFEKGTVLDVEVSAPGYLTTPVKYEVRRRRNLIPVILPDFVDDEPEIEPPVIQFGGDHPID